MSFLPRDKKKWIAPNYLILRIYHDPGMSRIVWIVSKIELNLFYFLEIVKNVIFVSEKRGTSTFEIIYEQTKIWEMTAERRSIRGILPNIDLSYYDTLFYFSRIKKDCRSMLIIAANPHTKCVKNDQIYSNLLSFPFLLLFGVGIAQTIVQFIESGLTGLEPATSVLTGRYSNQLNYNPTRYSLLTN